MVLRRPKKRVVQTVVHLPPFTMNLGLPMLLILKDTKGPLMPWYGSDPLPRHQFYPIQLYLFLVLRRGQHFHDLENEKFPYHLTLKLAHLCLLFYHYHSLFRKQTESQIFICPTIGFDCLLESFEFVLSPIWVAKIFVENNDGSSRNTFSQMIEYCLC